VIALLRRVGLITRAGLPRDEAMREDLMRANA
jgi:hypothetical protein